MEELTVVTKTYTYIVGGVTIATDKHNSLVRAAYMFAFQSYYV